VIKEVLAEQGLAGLPVLVCLCRHTGGEVVRCRLEGSRLILPGPGDGAVASWPLPVHLVAPVTETLATLAGEKGRKVTDLLDHKVTPDVRARLAAEGHLWSRHVVAGMNNLHRLADAAAAKLFWDRPERLRAWRRSAWATPDEVLPPSTDVVADDYDEAEAPFWALVAARLTAKDREGLARLDWDESS
jgi:hypothetical protein